MNSLNGVQSMRHNSKSNGSIIVGGKSGTNQEIIIPASNKTTLLSQNDFGKFGNGSFQIVNVSGDNPGTMQIITAVDPRDNDGDMMDDRLMNDNGQQLEVGITFNY